MIEKEMFSEFACYAVLLQLWALMVAVGEDKCFAVKHGGVPSRSCHVCVFQRKAGRRACLVNVRAVVEFRSCK